MVKNMLLKKIMRDMARAKWQFLSIVALCALGVLVFSGLDASWRDIDISVNRYFEAQRLTDFWIAMPAADRETERAIRDLNGVEDAQCRISIDVNAILPGEPALALHAFEGEARINIPALQSGAALAGDDAQGCLLEEQFARAQGLAPGDELTIRAENQDISFIIRGLVISPEYVVTAKELLPDPASFGFMYANCAAFPKIAMNEILALLKYGADGEAVKNEIESMYPYALVRDRNAHKSTAMIRGEVAQFRSLSGVFPILFFAVAALIVLTTVTRMVERQRTQTGVLKALGYSDGQILRYYLCYGFYPSVTGSAIGLIVGKYTLPGYMWALESTLFRLPPKVVAPISPISVAVLCVSVALSCLICYAACKKNACEVPASLMRPKAPKAGNRVLLERFPMFWNRLTFNAKMILRNIFRSKARAIMALLGVLCCTSLIIAALGFQDTFSNMVSTHYGQTLRYDLRAELKPNAKDLSACQGRIPAKTVEGLMERAVSVQGKNGSRTVVLSILEANQTLIDLGIDAQSNALDGGIIMTEKLAGGMGVQVGDIVTLKFTGESNLTQIEVAGLAPIGMGQGIYMCADLWESCQGSAFTPNAWLIREPYADCVDYINQLDAVDGMEWISVRREETMTALKSMIGITLLMAAFALTLAFVVLYNMGILNFVERTREFATLKVLGYHKKEIRSLIVRENALISCIGTALGVLPGLWLNAVVMRASAPDDMAFAPFVSVTTVCIACGLTLAFSLLIQRMLTRKVQSIDMVEALKSVE